MLKFTPNYLIIDVMKFHSPIFCTACMEVCRHFHIINNSIKHNVDTMSVTHLLFNSCLMRGLFPIFTLT